MGVGWKGGWTDRQTETDRQTSGKQRERGGGGGGGAGRSKDRNANTPPVVCLRDSFESQRQLWDSSAPGKLTRHHRPQHHLLRL